MYLSVTRSSGQTQAVGVQFIQLASKQHKNGNQIVFQRKAIDVPSPTVLRLTFVGALDQPKRHASSAHGTWWWCHLSEWLNEWLTVLLLARLMCPFIAVVVQFQCHLPALCGLAGWLADCIFEQFAKLPEFIKSRSLGDF